MEARPFRILSIDGGSIKGAFAAAALATFEQATGLQLVATLGTFSTLSTCAIALNARYSLGAHK
jgi:hypothetical protein